MIKAFYPYPEHYQQSGGNKEINQQHQVNIHNSQLKFWPCPKSYDSSIKQAGNQHCGKYAKEIVGAGIADEAGMDPHDKEGTDRYQAKQACIDKEMAS